MENSKHSDQYPEGTVTYHNKPNNESVVTIRVDDEVTGKRNRSNPNTPEDYIKKKLRPGRNE